MLKVAIHFHRLGVPDSHCGRRGIPLGFYYTYTKVAYLPETKKKDTPSTWWSFVKRSRLSLTVSPVQSTKGQLNLKTWWIKHERAWLWATIFRKSQQFHSFPSPICIGILVESTDVSMRCLRSKSRNGLKKNNVSKYISFTPDFIISSHSPSTARV